MQIGIASRPLAMPHCGDQARHWQRDKKIFLCMVDGLGHGKAAEHAALAAISFVEQHLNNELLEVFADCDKALRDTRGAVMGIAVADSAAGTLTYAGIGNTRAVVVGKEITSLRSHYGIVGGGYRTLKTTTVPLEPGDLVIMYTDGVQEHFDVSSYSQTLLDDTQRLTETILDDWQLGTDDAAVMAYHHGR